MVLADVPGSIVIMSPAVNTAFGSVMPPVSARVLFALATVSVPVVSPLICTRLWIVPPLIVGEVSVLFVSVSVVARPTSVSVEVGSVSVPVLTMVEMTGAVSVLLLSVSVEEMVGTAMPPEVIAPVAVLIEARIFTEPSKK